MCSSTPSRVLAFVSSFDFQGSLLSLHAASPRFKRTINFSSQITAPCTPKLIRPLGIEIGTSLVATSGSPLITTKKGTGCAHISSGASEHSPQQPAESQVPTSNSVGVSLRSSYRPQMITAVSESLSVHKTGGIKWTDVHFTVMNRRMCRF